LPRIRRGRLARHDDAETCKGFAAASESGAPRERLPERSSSATKYARQSRGF
jgi:hypothetical protein